MPKAALSRLSLTRLVKHFSTGSQAATTVSEPASTSFAPVSKAPMQTWQQERETAQTLRGTLQGYVSDMEALGQIHPVPSGLTDGPEPMTCAFLDHSCTVLKQHIKEFESLYLSEFENNMGKTAERRARERWMQFGNDVYDYYEPHIKAANGISASAAMSGKTSVAKREAEMGHMVNLNVLITSANISFAGSHLEDECTALLLKLTGELEELNTEYKDELSKRPLPVSAAGDKAWTGKLDTWIMASSRAITEIQKLRAHSQSHTGESQLSQVSYTAGNQNSNPGSAARDERRLQT